MPASEDIILRAVAVSNSLRARRGKGSIPAPRLESAPEPIRVEERVPGFLQLASAAAKRFFGVK